MAKIFLDFDNTLYDNNRQQADIYAVIESLSGVAASDIRKEYLTFKRDSHSEGELYTPERLLARLEVKYAHFPVDAVRTQMAEILSRGQEYLFPDTVEFLKSHHGTPRVLLTYGDAEWQNFKIENSGLLSHIDEVVISGDKHERIKERMDEGEEEVIFVDDKPVYFEDVRKLTQSNRDVTCVQMDRTNIQQTHTEAQQHVQELFQIKMR
jgi:FMN phosphatase YigB (HAD superfamily)